MHRVGRAGRFGNKGMAISFVSTTADPSGKIKDDEIFEQVPTHTPSPTPHTTHTRQNTPLTQHHSPLSPFPSTHTPDHTPNTHRCRAGSP